jgi:hypothetical protein
VLGGEVRAIKLTLVIYQRLVAAPPNIFNDAPHISLDVVRQVSQ